MVLLGDGAAHITEVEATIKCGSSSTYVPHPGGQGKHIRFKCKVAVSAVCALCTIHAQNAVPHDCTLAF